MAVQTTLCNSTTMDLTILLLSLLIITVKASDRCNDNSNCGKCIQDSFGCKWCSAENYAFNRCVPAGNLEIEKTCGISNIENPQSSLRNVPIIPDGKNGIIQIQPPIIKIDIRAGQTVDFDFTFEAADHYPVDMYFLVDNSKSMKIVKDAIAKAASQIYDDFYSVSKDVYLGIGTFVDKNAVPFTLNGNRPSANTYSYRNELPLTSDANKFKEIMSESASGENADSPEGGFDALAQAIACNISVGWRDYSRKIILFFTDETSHSAGDGRWAGITDPFDGECHTEGGAGGVYTKELEMDYPSISDINKLAVEKFVTIVFIVKDSHKDTYTQLGIKGSMVVTYTTKTLSDFKIDETLRNIYQTLTRKVKLNVEMPYYIKKNNYMEVKIVPDCTGDNNPECEVTKGEKMNFRGQIKLNRTITADEEDINISIQGVNEKLILQVHPIKSCDCETNEKKRTNKSEECTRRGTKMCGMCYCDAGRYGNTCGCDIGVRNDGTSTADKDKCRANNETTDLCSGRGNCECGSCVCLPDYKGQFCQCNTQSCPNNCNNHGICDCGKCVCDPNWTGEACECSTASCEQANKKECNGRAPCTCGKCQCPEFETWDARHIQDHKCVIDPCKDCHDKQCRLTDECAVCRHNRNEQCTACTDKINVTLVETLPDLEIINICQNVKVGVGCYIQYAYVYDDDYGIHLYVESKRDCLQSYMTYGAIFFVMLIIIGLGTALAWKFLNDARDRREYERFVTSAQNRVASCVSPIYEPPTTTFKNPAFRKKSVDYNL